MTANEIIGSLVYRTNNALNGNQKFLDAIKKYYFHDAVVSDDKLHLWHFPGTAQEISHVFQALSKDALIGSQLKFPAMLNFQGVIQEHKPDMVWMRFNLAIVSPVLSEWTTQQREEQVYRLVLKPIEDEFIRQVGRFKLFLIPLGDIQYTSVYIPTTGRALNSIMKVQYGDFLDVIELPNFVIKVLPICDAMSEVLIYESKKVTDEIKNLVKK